MTRSERSESELASLKRQASELASARRERLTTVHLLAAIASRQGPAADLLRERNLDRDVLLKAGRSFDEDDTEQLDRALASARDVAKRSRIPANSAATSNATTATRGRAISPDARPTHVEPGGTHLLVALLADRRLAAHRALLLSGVDVSRLRTLAVASAHGLAGARRTVESSDVGAVAESTTARAPTPRTATARGVGTGGRGAPSPRIAERPSVVPLFPPHDPARREPMKAETATSVEAAPTERVEPPHRAPASRPRAARRNAMAPNARAATRTNLDRPAANDHGTSVALRDLDRAAYPQLAACARPIDPTARAEHRGDAIERALAVLAKHRASTPCLVGAPGVGKTTVANALGATLAAEGGVVLEVRASALVAGSAARGSLSERLVALFTEARSLSAAEDARVTLVFDDAHELLSAGDEAAAELKSALAQGEVGVVLATSNDGYRRAIEADPQLARRVTPVEIDEPDEAAAFFMLRDASTALGAHHRARFADEALASAVSWSIRYLPGRALPDKALGALDEAAARARRAAGMGHGATIEVGRDDVARAIAALADVPVERLLETDRARLLRLEEQLAERVVGHKEPLTRIASMLRKSAAGLRARRPLGSFLLLGPTGVGKTETAKAIAEALFGASDAMTRIDMSELVEAHAVARLIGAPPGYVGHEAGGQLTEAVRKRPYQVVLLDEIEKAHVDVLLAFLQVLDEGHLTDARGRKVDFTNVVLVMTSNLGAKELAGAARTRTVGFARSSTPDLGAMAASVIEAAKRGLPIELFNRLDETLFFAPLTRAEMARIAEQMLGGLRESLAARGVRLEVEAAAIEALLDGGGFDPELGARPMRRAVARLVEAPLAELLLANKLESGSVALVGVEGGAVVVDALPPPSTTRRPN